jgi:dephospho-CoA kinase
MIWCIVTGGIACGKSTVLESLRQLSTCSVYSADEVVRKAYQNEEVSAQVRAALQMSGSGILTKEERVGLRARALQETEVKKILEGIFHPIAFAAMNAQRLVAQQTGQQVFVAEVPLYYETARKLDPDLVIVVAASRVSQLSRLCVDRGLDRETAEALLSIQLPVKDKADRADIVLWNDGDRLQLHRQTELLTRFLNKRIHDRNP